VRTRQCAALLCILIGGCGGGGNDKPKPISGPAKDAAGVIQRLEKATAKQDFATICDDLLASATRKEAGGDQCAEVLGQRAGSVRRPRIRIQAIEVRGNEALVRVRTTATGQAPTNDTIRLIRENGQYRVLSLGK
jgi:hypothetical protein